jgi:hypothetical protein
MNISNHIYIIINNRGISIYVSVCATIVTEFKHMSDSNRDKSQLVPEHIF